MRIRVVFIACVITALLGGCAPPRSDSGGGVANDVVAAVNVTTLPGASPSAGTAAVFSEGVPPYGTKSPPRVSNTVVSSVPGAPAKPIFVSQDGNFDAIVVSIQGKTGFFTLSSGGNGTLGLDVISSADALAQEVTLDIATQANGKTSRAAALRYVVDPHRFVAAGDLENHDADGSNVADLFGAFLEGVQGDPARPEQSIDGHNNNDDVVDGVKGPEGPVPDGHREVVWDGVPEGLRNQTAFNERFFDRQNDGAAGVRGGVIFTATNGSGEEVNDALAGSQPDPTSVGPPTNDNAEIGGDFSNHNPRYTGKLIAFTQPAAFAPLGSTVTDLTFHVAGSTTPAVVGGVGVVFVSVDEVTGTSIELFNEDNERIAFIPVPPQSHGPFPFAGPVADDADNIPFSFAGYVNREARIARVRITSGEVPLDTAAKDAPGSDVVAFDDVYYAEPRP